MEYNKKKGIKPKTINKAIREIIESTMVLEEEETYSTLEEAVKADHKKLEEIIKEHEKQMAAAAKELRFEEAAKLRDEIAKLKKQKKQNVYK